MLVLHFGPKPTTRGSISNKKKISHGTAKAHREMRQPARASVRHLLSEDFQDGFELQDVTFISPFNLENNQLIDKPLPQS